MIAKNVVKRKRYLLLLLVFFALIYLLIKVLTFYAHSLSVFEFAFLATFFGLAPAYYFRKVLRYENIVGWLVNSSVFGMLFIPFLFVVLGWLGVNLVFVYSIYFLYGCSLLGMILLLVFADDVSVEYYLNGLTKVDILFYGVLVSYTFILTLLNFNHVYIQWDAFTFWGLDAKYIFQLNQLRDSTLDVFGSFRYTAYYPVYYSIIYDFYGTVAEQYANWVNVFFNFLAMLLIYNNVLRKRNIQKILIVAMLVVVSYSAVLVVYMFSMYADVLCAFNLLLFMMILTAKNSYDLEMYSRRMFLLLLLAISLYFIKSPFIFLTCLLLFVYVLHDLKYLLVNCGNLVRRADFWLAILATAILYMMRFYYFTAVIKVGSNTPVSDLYLPRFISPYSSIQYAGMLISWLFNRSPYLAGIWCLGISSVFLVNKQRLDKNYYYLYWISFGVVLSYLVVYVINQSDLSSGSLVRYCAIVMYLTPLMFTYVEIELSRIKSYALAVSLLVLSGYVFVKTMTPMPLHERFTLSTGSYNVVLRKESKVAEAVLRISGDDARILIADDFPNSNILSNMYLDAIFVRYLLMFNSVGGQYMMDIDNFYDYALGQRADYILLLTYANSFSQCEKIFVVDHNYLIKTDKDKYYSENGCIFSDNTVFDLSEK